MAVVVMLVEGRTNFESFFKNGIYPGICFEVTDCGPALLLKYTMGGTWTTQVVRIIPDCT